VPGPRGPQGHRWAAAWLLPQRPVGLPRPTPAMLRARLPAKCSPAEHLELPEGSPLLAKTWSVSFGALGARPAVACLKDLEPALGGRLDNVYVQFRMDSLGRHEYVCLGEVLYFVRVNSLDMPLTVLSEEQVKVLGQRMGGALSLLNAVPAEMQLPAAPVEFLPSPARAVDAADADLCPPRGPSDGSRHALTSTRTDE